MASIEFAFDPSQTDPRIILSASIYRPRTDDVWEQWVVIPRKAAARHS